MIEIYKHQFQDLSSIIAQVKNRNYRFIIYMDDLSFEDFEIEYKYLKAVIEGGMETKPDNVLIYATSNRRHLIKETWSDRDDIEVDNGMHRSDTMQEKLSLVARFGVTIYYGKPSQKEYFTIVKELRKRYPAITCSDEELCQEANKWELSHGGISGRTAQQFINDMAGKGRKSPFLNFRIFPSAPQHTITSYTQEVSTEYGKQRYSPSLKRMRFRDQDGRLLHR